MEFFRDLFVGTFALVGQIIWGILWLTAIVYIVLDAKRRDRSGCLAFLLAIIVPFPINIIIWVLVRPKGEYGRLF